jgi:hypothetical protein
MKFFIYTCLFLTFSNQIVCDSTASEIRISDEEINKILKAKEIVKNMVNYPDTLVFHDLYTKVSGNTVTLKFTCKNAFGTPETHVLDIKVN